MIVIPIPYQLALETAQKPHRATTGAAAYDLYAASPGTFNGPGGYWEFDTGVVFEIPQGYVGLLYPRSSISNTGASLANSVGVIDSDYRGTVRVRFYSKREDAPYAAGDRVAQIMFQSIPDTELIEKDTISATPRGFGGFGSTGSN